MRRSRLRRIVASLGVAAAGIDSIAFGALWIGGRIVVRDLDRIRPAEAAARMPHVPTLIFAGSADDRAPIDDARRIAAAAPRAEVVVVPGADHAAVLAYTASDDALVTIAALIDEIAAD